MKNILGDAPLALLGLALIAAVLLLPFATIWSLNTLFPVLAIPSTFWTWLAMIIFYGFFKTKVEINK